MMIAGTSIAVLVADGLGLIFGAAGIANLVGPAGMRAGFERWGYPDYWHLVNGFVLLAAGVLAVLGPTRLFGLGLGALVCLAALATLLRHREMTHSAPALILCAVTLLDAAAIATGFGLRPG